MSASVDDVGTVARAQAPTQPTPTPTSVAVESEIIPIISTPEGRNNEVASPPRSHSPAVTDEEEAECTSLVYPSSAHDDGSPDIEVRTGWTFLVQWLTMTVNQRWLMTMGN